MGFQVPEKVLLAALFLALVVKAVTEYLKAPLINSPKILAWMCKVGLAYTDENGAVTVWWIPYVTFVLGGILSYLLRVDLVSGIFLTITPGSWPALLLTAAIVGVGSNLINDLFGKTTGGSLFRSGGGGCGCY